MKSFPKSYLIPALIILLTLLTASCIKRLPPYEFNTKVPRFALILPGSVTDSAWNSAAYQGLKRLQNDYKHIQIAVVERVNLSDTKKVVNELKKRNFDLIIAHGFAYNNYLKLVARKYKKIFFCIVGGETSQEPNLASLNFKDEQYGYLVGVVAGLNTSTNKVGIVVGGKIPSIERSIIGIRKGLRSVNPKADLVVSYINTWSNILKGREAAFAQINTGVDIITHLADFAGVGVIKAAEEADISAIGALTDQHDIAPSVVITSAIEDASQLVYLAGEYYLEQFLRPVVYKFGLKHQVIDLSTSYGNIDPTTETRIKRIKDKLTDKEVTQEEHTKAKQQEKKDILKMLGK